MAARRGPGMARLAQPTGSARGPGQDEAADQLRPASGEVHGHVAAERQADDHRPAVRFGLDVVGHDRPPPHQGEPPVGQRAVAGQVDGQAAVRVGRAASWAAHIAAGQARAVDEDDDRRADGTGAARCARSRGRVEAVLDGEQRRLRPAGQPELGEDVRDVGPGRALGDAELVGDGPVGEPAGDAGEDVPLAGGQRRERGRRGVGPRATAARRRTRIRRATMPGDGRIEVDLARRRPPGSRRPGRRPRRP